MSEQTSLDAIRHYVAMRDARPMNGLDDAIHCIHTGTEFAAELRLSDLRALLVPAQQPMISAAELSRFIHNYDRFLAQYIATNLLHHFDVMPKTDLAKAATVPISVASVSDLLVRLRDFLSMTRPGDSYKYLKEIEELLNSPRAGASELTEGDRSEVETLRGQVKALLKVVDDRLEQYAEIESRNDLSDYGVHAQLAAKNIRRDMAAALSSTERGCK